jgi:hypothetical protein
MRNWGGAVIPGLLLIALGAWLLAGTLGLHLPGLDVLWPIILVVFGLACLLQFFADARRNDGLVFTGVTSTLLGGFFLAITLGPLKWPDLNRWWPVFVIIGGVAFLAQWLARPGQRGLLVPAGLALLVGLTALGVNLGLVRADLAERITRLWPLLLIVVGLGLLANYVVVSRRKE